ncbi:MAG: Peptidyl-tRNA hydrolase [Chlamydiae bacterium]|nr:Peptidyl-tRNA hydrolase [Chlamydiota bacterium]
MDRKVLLVGLGNPGEKYANTRHNFGFRVLQEFAKAQGWSWKKKWRLRGYVVQGVWNGVTLILLLPSTYVNLSGIAVARAVEYYKVTISDLLVLVDEMYLPFGKMRIRAKGSAGGHNGLKSVQNSLHTQDYARLRLGVGPKEEISSYTGRLEDYVLGFFSSEEQKVLPDLLHKGQEITLSWVKEGVEVASQIAGNN